MRTDHLYELPATAYDSLADPAIKLELHGISFSHYVERTRWTLRLLGIPYTEVRPVRQQYPSKVDSDVAAVVPAAGCVLFLAGV
jgi:hypothetical protein